MDNEKAMRACYNECNNTKNKTTTRLEQQQEMLNEGRDTQADLEAEHAHWMHIRKTTRLYGTRHSEAWAKSDSIAEVLRWYNT